MDLVRLVLNLALWTAIAGFIVFCVLYSILTSPWRDHMGRHVLAFMLGLGVSFLYGGVSRFIPVNPRLVGWTIFLILIAVLVWWRVALLIKYQVQARRSKSS